MLDSPDVLDAIPDVVAVADAPGKAGGATAAAVDVSGWKENPLGAGAFSAAGAGGTEELVELGKESGCFDSSTPGAFAIGGAATLPVLMPNGAAAPPGPF